MTLGTHYRVPSDGTRKRSDRSENCRFRHCKSESLSARERESSEAPNPSPNESARSARHVFLSHSKHDGDFAELTKLELEKNVLVAWIDSDRLDPGVDWQEIDDSIKTAVALVPIMTPKARESEYVTYAWGCDVPLIPLMLRETSLHPRLAILQYLDFTNRKARDWEHLYDAIRKVQNGEKTRRG